MDNRLKIKKNHFQKYRAKCDYIPDESEIVVSTNKGTLSNPSTPKLNRKNNILSIPSEKLEKCSSEPDVAIKSSTSSVDHNKFSTKNKPSNSKSEDNLPKTDIHDIFLSFAQGDEFEVLSKCWKAWWAVKQLKGDKLVGLVPANYLTKIEKDEENDNESLEIARSEDNKALKELHARIKELYPGLQLGATSAMIPEPEFPPPPTHEELQRDNEGLIIPRKPHNPCVDSSDHKNLHRELLFNQKAGKNVLNQKSELQRAMEKHKEQVARKEAEKEKVNNKTAFERVIEERARRLETLEKQEETAKNIDANQPEFLQVHAKLRARMDSK